MRARTAVMLPMSLLLGFVAIQAGRFWLDRQVAQRVKAYEAIQPQAAETKAQTTIVVTTTQVVAGSELTASNLREVPWYQATLPKGTFASVHDLVGSGKRYATVTLDAEDVVLQGRITGPGIRPNLASSLAPEMKALSVRIDEIVGVAGFVLPGDRVDVLLTRVLDRGNAVNDLVLQNVKVLAVDQIVDDRASKPALAKTATLEVDTRQAQKLMVAQASGSLTLMLRPAGVARLESEQHMTLAELLAGGSPPPATNPSDPAPVVTPRTNALVGVTRGTARQEYTVPASATLVAATLGTH